MLITGFTRRLKTEENPASNKAENVKNNHYSPPHVTVLRLKMSAAAS